MLQRKLAAEEQLQQDFVFHLLFGRRFEQPLPEDLAPFLSDGIDLSQRSSVIQLKLFGRQSLLFEFRQRRIDLSEADI